MLPVLGQSPPFMALGATKGQVGAVHYCFAAQSAALVTSGDAELRLFVVSAGDEVRACDSPT